MQLLHSFEDRALHLPILEQPSRQLLIEEVMRRREALVTQTGALAVWNPRDSTARIPDDTYIVRSKTSEEIVDWHAPNNHAMDRQIFDRLLEDALETLGNKQRLYRLHRSVGAEDSYALPARMLTDSAIAALFADTMFRPLTPRMKQSVFATETFTLLVLPHDKLSPDVYEGKLRIVKGEMITQVIAMDLERRIGIVYGTSYLGAIKKMLFTVMNTILPDHDVLPLHCAATEDSHGETHLFLGLSGTGKTTLSTDEHLTMIGDDEHLWSAHGIANMEGGCYAKLIRLHPEKERQIYDAVFTPRSNISNGCIIENAMVFPDGSIDLDDMRLTENSRAAYPLTFLPHAKSDAKGDHPSTIFFLTADAHGVLPPLSKLTLDQALLWFLMGYTSKLAGTEAGVTTPKSAFSRFFGAPFMPRKPADYLSLFRKYISTYHADVYLVNTGWSGGRYGVGKRMDISLTRSLLRAAMRGDLHSVQYREDHRFHLFVPERCPGVDASILDPRRTWKDPAAYDQSAEKLAQEFSAAFEKNFAGAVASSIAAQCPGR